MIKSDNWFTEICEPEGAAFSLKTQALLHKEKTPFQEIAIYQTEKFGNLMIIDGFYMLSQRENFLYHEMLAHPVLFTHPDPKKILIIGGGDCGTLCEVLKHPGVEKAQQIEIDERVTRLSEEYFPELCSANNDPRAELLFIDGIEYVQEAAENSFDLIIIDSTDPIGPAEGLFTKPFYAQCFRTLRKNGIIVQQSESPLYHVKLIKEMRAAMGDVGFAQSKTLFFPQPCYPSGWWSATMAAKDSLLSEFREQDARQKTFDTVYYNAEIHRASQALPEFFRKEMTAIAKAL